MIVTRRHALAAGSSALLLPGLARAQAAWPTGPVTFVVGYSAGGSTDINARELAQVMTPVIGQQIIIDNKGGAAGSIGLRAVANAKPDGYTLFVAVGTNVIINPHVQKGMIDTIASLAPVCQVTDYQYVLVVGQSVPAKNAAELVAMAKKDPEKLTYSSSGVGGNNHLAGALFAGLAFSPVGTAAARSDHDRTDDEARRTGESARNRGRAARSADCADDAASARRPAGKCCENR